MPKTRFTDAHQVFVDVLIAARKKAGLNQTELSGRVSHTQQYISRVESGDQRIDVVEFVAISRAMEADPAKLFAQALKKLPKRIEY